MRGRGTITQQGDELCHVTFELNEYRPERGALPIPFSFGPPSQFEGSMQVTGGIPLDVGLQDLLLEMPDGRRVAIDVASLNQNGRQETYEVRGSVQSWWSRIRFQSIRRPST